jgi:deoxyribonuclease V
MRSIEGEIDFPYVPGFLSFREAPLCVDAVRSLRIKPDLLLVDGHGKAHPMGCGVACHIGVELEMPTIGVAKSRLVGSYEEPGDEKGSISQLTYRGNLVGNVVRTRSSARPVFVSVGQLITLDEAVAWTITLARRFRLPEPSHLAHRTASQLARDARRRQAGDST